MIEVTDVRHISSKEDFIYIGRTCGNFYRSIYHNPFFIGKDGNREEVLLKFMVYWYAPEQKWLRERALKEISPNAVLGCWCYPFPCHGDIIAGYLDWKHVQTSSTNF